MARVCWFWNFGPQWEYVKLAVFWLLTIEASTILQMGMCLVFADTDMGVWYVCISVICAYYCFGNFLVYVCNSEVRQLALLVHTVPLYSFGGVYTTVKLCSAGLHPSINNRNSENMLLILLQIPHWNCVRPYITPAEAYHCGRMPANGSHCSCDRWWCKWLSCLEESWHR